MSEATACKLVRELRGNVVMLVTSKNGNHVIQKCIKKCISADCDQEDLVEGQHFIVWVGPRAPALAIPRPRKTFCVGCFPAFFVCQQATGGPSGM